MQIQIQMQIQMLNIIKNKKYLYRYIRTTYNTYNTYKTYNTYNTYSRIYAKLF